MKTCGWHFPTSDGGEEDGVNDSGLEMFEGDHAYFLAREIIQNSIDARRPDSAFVEVHFHVKHLDLSSFPAWDDFQDILKACLTEVRRESAGSGSSQKSKGEILYEHALSLNGKIPVLVVEDHGTTGLCGDETERGGQWYKCIRKKGTNRPTGDVGGTFGIGKHAPFPASNLRTVFYSTINDKNEHVFAGKAILSSFEVNGDVKRGTGFYGHLEGHGVSGVRAAEDIPHFFLRESQGLSVFIMGFKDKGNWESNLKKAVLENYFSAIDRGVLKVVFEAGGKQEKIDRFSLKDFVEEYAPETLQYLMALKEPLGGAPKVGNIRGIGEVKLYLSRGKDYDRKVAFMRRPLIVVQKRKSNLVYEPFAGVFICEDREGNRALSALEPPTHDKWDPKRDSENGINLMTRLNEWLNAELRKLNVDTGNEREDMVALSEYLADDSDLPGERGTGPDGKEKKVDESGCMENVNQGRDIISSIATKFKTSHYVLTGGGGHMPRKRTKPGKNAGTNGAGPGEKGPQKVDIKMGIRWIPESDTSTKARLILRPEENFSGRIRLVGVGEDDLSPIDIKSARIGGKSVEVLGGDIKNMELSAGTTVDVFLELHEKAWEAISVEAYDCK